MSTIWEADSARRDDGVESDAERLVAADFTEDDLEIDRTLRPKSLDEYLGQSRVKENLSVLIEAARRAAKVRGSRRRPRPPKRCSLWGSRRPR
jgi:hypothetical protein